MPIRRFTNISPQKLQLGLQKSTPRVIQNTEQNCSKTEPKRASSATPVTDGADGAGVRADAEFPNYLLAEFQRDPFQSAGARKSIKREAAGERGARRGGTMAPFYRPGIPAARLPESTATGSGSAPAPQCSASGRFSEVSAVINCVLVIVLRPDFGSQGGRGGADGRVQPKPSRVTPLLGLKSPSAPSCPQRTEGKSSLCPLPPP